MTDPIPLLFCGDVGGRFDYLFKKVNNILNKHESGKLFKMLLCVGDFFGDDPIASSAYFANNKGPTKEEQISFYSKEVETLDENIIYLGKCGVYTTVEGLRIAYVSGTEGDESETKFCKKNIYNLISYACKDKHTRVDVLITYQWPESITNNLETKDSFSPENPSKLLSYCVCQLKPQYHLSASEQHDFERQPFEHKYGSLILGYTRFVGLGKVAKDFKGRSIYALKMNCLVDNLETRVPKTTSKYPFAKMLEIEHKIDKSDDNGQFFYLSTPETQRIAKKRKLDEHKSDCWFCFSNPRFEKQYVVHVAEQAYLALAKGGIVHMHILISTVSHYPTLRSAPPEIQEEVKKYKETLVKYFKSTNMDVIFYERAFMAAHLTIQCIALTENQVNKFKTAITKQATTDNIDLKRHPHGTYSFNELPNDASYFFLEISNKDEFMVHIKDDYFPMAFGRETIAKDILDQPIKKDWRKCILDDDDAVYWVSRISKGYKHFAFQ